jgi:hypothetical protein
MELAAVQLDEFSRLLQSELPVVVSLPATVR